MKKISVLLLGLLFVIALYSCSRSNKAKLTNKWVVQYAEIYSPEVRNIKDWATDTLAKIITSMQNDYKGQEYDLKEDGTFSTAGKLKNLTGKWDEKDGEVMFTTSDGKQAEWKSIGKKVEIGHDSILIVRLTLGSDSSYVQLHLKPAPGQAVKTDY